VNHFPNSFYLFLTATLVYQSVLILPDQSILLIK